MQTRIKTVGLLGALFFSAAWFGSASAQTPPAQPTVTSVPASGVELYALTDNNRLLRFTAGAPGTITGDSAIAGLQANENLIGIDFRPATGQLFGLGSASRLYTIDPASGAATAVGSGPFTATLSGAEFGFDFNPVVDRIRVVSDQRQDLRLNPNTGGVAAVDGTLTFTSTDTNANQTPNVVAAAYTNNFPGPASTVLYNIDSNLDILVTQNPPNAGALNTVGPLGVDVSSVAGFDIVGGNTAFAALSVGGSTGLYTVNLGTGAATLIGPVGSGQVLRGLTGALSAQPATVTPAPATGTPGTPAATGTAQATAPAASPTEQATALPATPTTAAAPTMLPSTPTAGVPTPTVAPMPFPTTVAPGMPSTGQAESGLYIMLVLSGIVLLGLGLASRLRGSSSNMG